MAELMDNDSSLERIIQLEAKCYFNWGLSQADSDELDNLIAEVNADIETGL